jgi:hypothetical protein
MTSDQKPRGRFSNIVKHMNKSQIIQEIRDRFKFQERIIEAPKPLKTPIDMKTMQDYTTYARQITEAEQMKPFEERKKTLEVHSILETKGIDIRQLVQ